jgi:Uma2 family endonuclease
MNRVTLNLAPISKLADQQFYELCAANPDLKFERNSTGEVIILAPTGGETEIYNAGLIAQFWNWNDRQKLGKVFDSSTCFQLPLGKGRDIIKGRSDKNQEPRAQGIEHQGLK